MRIIYMGTPVFACPPLEALFQSRHEVVSVVTVPDKPAGRGQRPTPTPTCEFAESLGIEVLKPASLTDNALYEALKALSADLIVVVAFRILPERLFTLPRYGAINIHASLLPKYRGAAPVNWALINGETKTGLTSFYLKKKVDTGDIILQKETTIDYNDNFDSLYARLSESAGSFLLESLDLIEEGRTSPLPQNDSLATPAPKINPFDALTDFGFPAERVRNFVRGLSSKPGAYTYFRQTKLKILGCEVVADYRQSGIRPGTIITNRKQLVVQCADSAVALTCVVPEGKKQMDGGSFINGYKPQQGEILGEVSAETMK